MSYGAYVICRCYQDGKTSKPPYQEYVKFDKDGFYLDYPSPNDDASEEEWDAYFEKESEFEQWKENACPHKEMEQAYESIANSMGMGEFRHFIEINGGNQQFPILSKGLPKANGGIMSTEDAQKAFDELQMLKRLNVAMDKIVLREKESQAMVMIGDYDQPIPFAFFDKDKMFFLNNQGFYILERMEENGAENHYVLFHATQFYTLFVEEHKIAFCKYDENNQLEVFYASMGLRDAKQSKGERTDFEVVKETVHGADYWSSVIDSLEIVFKASIETKNPVHWC